MPAMVLLTTGVSCVHVYEHFALCSLRRHAELEPHRKTLAVHPGLGLHRDNPLLMSPMFVTKTGPATWAPGPKTLKEVCSGDWR